VINVIATFALLLVGIAGVFLISRRDKVTRSASLVSLLTGVIGTFAGVFLALQLSNIQAAKHHDRALDRFLTVAKHELGLEHHLIRNELNQAKKGNSNLSQPLTVTSVRGLSVFQNLPEAFLADKYTDVYVLVSSVRQRTDGISQVLLSRDTPADYRYYLLDVYEFELRVISQELGIMADFFNGKLSHDEYNNKIRQLDRSESVTIFKRHYPNAVLPELQ